MNEQRWSLLGVPFSTGDALLVVVAIVVALAVCWLLYVVAWAVWS